MSELFSRVISRLMPGKGKRKPKPETLELLGQAEEQRAMFQMVIMREKGRQSVHYMVCREVCDSGVILSSVDPYFTFQSGWMNKEFPFRFLVQTSNELLPLLHKFQGRITEVHGDKRTITVAAPGDIKILEHRRNVRLRLHHRHLPGLKLWGLSKNEDDPKGALSVQRLILDLAEKPGEVGGFLKNISAGGLRLELPSQTIIHHGPWLTVNSRMLVRLNFPVGDPSQRHVYLFLAKVGNSKANESRTRLALGLQFLSLKDQDAKSPWTDVSADGCNALSRLIGAYQMEYYRELKKCLIMREGLTAQKIMQKNGPKSGQKATEQRPGR